MRIVTALIGLALFSACASSGPAGPGSTFKECSTCPEMVVIPPGQFEMGAPDDELNRGSDEGPVRTVTHANAFAIGKYEITRKQFAAFVNETGYWGNARCLIWNGTQLAFEDANSWLDPDYDVSDDHPMVCVSWWDAVAYAAWLSDKTGYTYRLPAEAEWEYAVRGGTQTAYSFPGDENNACAYGNVSDRSAKTDVPVWNAVKCDDGVGFGTAPVGSYLPNALVCTTPSAMSGNGWLIATATISLARPLTAPPGAMVESVTQCWIAAAASVIFSPGTCAQPIAAKHPHLTSQSIPSDLGL